MKKLKVRIISLFLALVLGMNVIPISVFATEINSVTFAGGDGSEDNPYQISTPEQLNAVRNNLSASYVLINDIDLNDWGNWESIGVGDSLYGITPPANPPQSDYQPFTGNFDGSNYSIKNLKISDYKISYTSDCYGLFATVDSGAVKDLKLIDVSITINKSSTDYEQIQEEHRGTYAVYAGGISGKTIDTVIENCSVDGTINVMQCDNAFVGGICGTGAATNCVNDIDISVNNVSSTWCGGIIGATQAVNSNISKCINYGNVDAESDGFVYVGGITGEYGKISDCVNLATIFGKVVEPKSGHSSFAGICNAGGIVGATSSEYVKNSINYGCVSAYLDCTGISNYGNTYSHAYAGGIVGYCGFYGSGFINQCYNISSSISCTKISNTGSKLYQNAGRISGYSIKNNNCFSAISTSINDVFITSSQSTTNDGQDIEKDACILEETYIGFDFQNIWIIEETIGGAILKYAQNSVAPNYPINPGSSFKQLYFNEEAIILLDVDESKTLNVHSRDVANVNGQLVYSNDTTVDNTLIDWNPKLLEDAGIIKVTADGKITGLSKGYANLSIHLKDDLNLGTFCHVFVGSPTEFNYTATYDTKQYYAEGGFFSEVSSITDCVELYLSLENKIAEKLANVTGVDEVIANDTTKEHFKNIAPIKLTATINGSNLSFERDSYKNTYTTTLNTISVKEAVDELLMLFPYNLNVATSGNKYTVKVTLESDSFDTITESYSFTVENLSAKSANEHISFASTNEDYTISKKNIYGKEMATLKKDAEYKWSKVTSLDFDNYYEVVLADMLASVLGANQVELPSLMPKVLKDWVGTYKTLLGSITTIVNDDYSDVVTISSTQIDKWMKISSKYETDGIYANDELYQTVLDLLGNAGNVEKINKVFKNIDKTGKAFGHVKFGVNVLKDAVDWGNKLSLYNTYASMNDEFKAVMKTFADSIPSNEWRMKEAVYDYVNYSGDTSEQVGEILESFTGVLKDVSLDVFNSVIGQSITKYVFGTQVLNWLGAATVTLQTGEVVAFSSTAAFGGVQAAFGSFFTGLTLGVCISDVICDNSGKSVEMSKVVAMSEFSPYVIDTLNHYESKLYSDRNDDAVTHFEYAFALHKATQSYIMQHTVNSLEVKRDSVVIKLFNRDDWDGLISDILAQKRTIDNLTCHNTNPESTVVSQTKVITIKCPVDVYIYDENGAEVVKIINNTKELVAQGINVLVESGEKYIALPADQKYSIKIIATDSGIMDYSVTEYGNGVTRLRTVSKAQIPLINNRIFTGQIVADMGVNPLSYALNYDSTSVVPNVEIDIPVTGIELNKQQLEMNIGDSIELIATILPDNATNKNVTWNSSNTDVVTVDANGKIKTSTKGSAIITVSSNDWGYVATCVVSVDCSHNFEWIIDQNPSANSTGLKHEECSICGYKRSENTSIPATGTDSSINNSQTDQNATNEASVLDKTSSPETGDDSYAVLWIVVLFISGTLFVSLSVCKRKRARRL